jgi:hypothetical protein
MTTKQKIINLVSLVLLVLVFWNFFKPKINRAEPSQTALPSNSFEKGLDCKCDQDYVVASALKVIKKLKDDDRGNRHQKWLVQARNGQTILLVHNLELCKPLNLNKNDIIDVAGEFKWTDKGGLLHWAHFDPSNHRKAGYIQFHGENYCQHP